MISRRTFATLVAGLGFFGRVPRIRSLAKTAAGVPVLEILPLGVLVIRDDAFLMIDSGTRREPFAVGSA